MMNRNVCSKCGKPVYFAERKTSLGKDWHPSCLRCEECGKVLAPGQHAEHKGKPYCHNPCYKAKFGPKMVGYGSNVSSPANFGKNSVTHQQNGLYHTSIQEDEEDGDGATRSPVHRVLTQDQRRFSDVGFTTNNVSAASGTNSVDLEELGVKCVYDSDHLRQRMLSGQQEHKKVTITRSQSDVGRVASTLPAVKRRPIDPKREELLKRVQSYNGAHESKRGQALQVTEASLDPRHDTAQMVMKTMLNLRESKEDGEVIVSGPLRIYWGLKKPIMLKTYDEVPASTTSSSPLRYSVYGGDSDHLQKEAEKQKQALDSLLTPNQRKSLESDIFTSSPKKRQSHGMDDSYISSPVADVVMRKTNIRKSNTVAYRGDRPNKWKRASINGHIYNFDTSVFTPVLGSCTSVTVDSKMSVIDVIRTLLDKFKVENEPGEYNLYIMTEKESERILRNSDIPLLERLSVGQSDSIKLFIRDRPDVPPIVPQSDIPGEDHETPLPEEVEQLVNLPEPLLKNLLKKFENDESTDVSRIRLKYERVKKKIRQVMAERKLNISHC